MKHIDSPTLIASCDDTKHSAPLSVRVPPDWLRQIDTIVKYKKLPYCNRGDFVRDAIYKHFNYLEQLEEIPNSVFGKIQAMQDMIEETRRQQGFESVIKSLEERVDYFLQENARQEAVKYVLRVLQYANEIPEGYWKIKFVTKIKNRYAGLLKSATKARLSK